MPKTQPEPQVHDRSQEIWELGITELAGHNIESHGRELVNQMLKDGWVLLHIYTLKYQEDGTWRERPMAILGYPERAKNKNLKSKN